VANWEVAKLVQAVCRRLKANAGSVRPSEGLYSLEAGPDRKDQNIIMWISSYNAMAIARHIIRYNRILGKERIVTQAVDK